MLRSTQLLRLSRSSARFLASPPAPTAGSGSNHLPTAHRLRETTGITGLAVHHSPLPTLAGIFQSTLALLKTLPETSVYRQSVEAITEQRLEVVNKYASSGQSGDKDEGMDEATIEKVEEELDAGLIEEVIEQAKDEQALAGKMLEWKR